MDVYQRTFAGFSANADSPKTCACVGLLSLEELLAVCPRLLTSRSVDGFEIAVFLL